MSMLHGWYQDERPLYKHLFHAFINGEYFCTCNAGVDPDEMYEGHIYGYPSLPRLDELEKHFKDGYTLRFLQYTPKDDADFVVTFFRANPPPIITVYEKKASEEEKDLEAKAFYIDLLE